MKIIEVQFDGHVRVPGNQRATNVLRTVTDNHIGTNVLVDSLEEDDRGVIATKTVENDGKLVKHRKRYAWACVQEVVYDPIVTPIKAVDAVEEKKK